MGANKGKRSKQAAKDLARAARHGEKQRETRAKAKKGTDNE
jgi:hypothetical protein